MLEYLKIMEGKLMGMFSIPSIIKEKNNALYKGYMKEKLKMESEKDSSHVDAIYDSIKRRL